MGWLRAPVLACALLLAACASPVPPVAAVQHVVIVWLKNPGDAEARDRLIDASRRLRAIPGVLGVAAGEPLPSERAQVDASYDVAVVITLADRQALAEYQKHPLHLQALREVMQPLARRVLVYDFGDRAGAGSR